MFNLAYTSIGKKINSKVMAGFVCLETFCMMQLTQWRTLDIAHCLVSVLETFCMMQLTQWRTLDIAHCLVSVLETFCMMQLTQWRTLDIAHCFISVLEIHRFGFLFFLRHDRKATHSDPFDRDNCYWCAEYWRLKWGHQPSDLSTQGVPACQLRETDAPE